MHELNAKNAVVVELPSIPRLLAEMRGVQTSSGNIQKVVLYVRSKRIPVDVRTVNVLSAVVVGSLPRVISSPKRFVVYKDILDEDQKTAV